MDGYVQETVLGLFGMRSESRPSKRRRNRFLDESSSIWSSCVGRYLSQLRSTYRWSQLVLVDEQSAQLVMQDSTPSVEGTLLLLIAPDFSFAFYTLLDNERSKIEDQEIRRILDLTLTPDILSTKRKLGHDPWDQMEGMII